MPNELVRYATGEVAPAKSDRAVAGRAKSLYDDTRYRAMQADARLALGAHIMDRVAQLDRQRKALCSPEDALHGILVNIEVTAIEQAQAIQKGERPAAAPKRDPWAF